MRTPQQKHPTTVPPLTQRHQMIPQGQAAKPLRPQLPPATSPRGAKAMERAQKELQRRINRSRKLGLLKWQP